MRGLYTEDDVTAARNFGRLEGFVCGLAAALVMMWLVLP